MIWGLALVTCSLSDLLACLPWSYATSRACVKQGTAARTLQESCSVCLKGSRQQGPFEFEFE